MASCILVLAVATTAGAQMGGVIGRPQPRGLFNPVVGCGAQYEIQGNGRDKMVMEIDVVGKESVDGKDGYWIESTVSNTQMGQIVTKMLAVLDGAKSTVSKMIMQMGEHPPMEMPTQMMSEKGSQPVDIRGQAEDSGTESVTTSAGTFIAHHYRMKDGSGDSWISEQISPYGLIKHEGKDSTMVLTKVVTHAKDKVIGTPGPFNPAELLP